MDPIYLMFIGRTVVEQNHSCYDTFILTKLKYIKIQMLINYKCEYNTQSQSQLQLTGHKF